MKTQSMEPQDAEAFPLISWQDALSALKVFATERVTELKTIRDGNNAALAKIEACNSKISDMKCWRTFKLKAQKHFFELLSCVPSDRERVTTPLAFHPPSLWYPSQI